MDTNYRSSTLGTWHPSAGLKTGLEYASTVRTRRAGRVSGGVRATRR